VRCHGKFWDNTWTLLPMLMELRDFWTLSHDWKFSLFVSGSNIFKMISKEISMRSQAGVQGTDGILYLGEYELQIYLPTFQKQCFEQSL
jgi:hypothetical protein